MNYNVIGIDIAKLVFQLYWIEMSTGEIKNLKLKREKFLAYFVNLAPCIIGMEACGGAHHWARELTKLGHTVKLISGKRVKSFVMGNKNDAADACAIWTAMQQPNTKEIAIKTVEQQAILTLHRQRECLKKIRTMQINALRGFLTEFGEVMPQSQAGLNKGIAAAIDRVSLILPGVVIESLRDQWQRIGQLAEQMLNIERQLQSWLKTSPEASRLMAIPGVGLLSATAAVANMGNAKRFQSGRQFAASLGIVPAQTGTGGKVRLLGISKRGDTYLRTLLIHGARSVLIHSKNPPKWLQELKQRRPMNVVVVALANKMARMIWAILAHGRIYDAHWVSQVMTTAVVVEK